MAAAAAAAAKVTFINSLFSPTSSPNAEDIQSSIV